MKEPNENTVEIPIIIRRGKVEFFYGGPLPELKEGQIGKIEIPADAFVNQQDVARLSVHETVLLLPEGMTLQVHMALQGAGKPPPGLHSIRATEGFWGNGGFAEIFLKDPLQLTFRGTKKPLLEPCKCSIPTLATEAASVNQAYSRLSERFEQHRRSHTGNVFSQVFYLPDGKQSWEPLENLRRQREAEFETRMFNAHGMLFGP